MLDLNVYAKLPEKRMVTEKDWEEFETVGFDPEELLQLKEMNRKELIGLMVFCGIRVFNEVPLIVLEEDEMRMAYLVWRADKMTRKKSKVAKRMERGIQWLNTFKKVAERMM